MARPTKYTETLLIKANEYLRDVNHCGVSFPSHIGLSSYLNTDALYDWAKQPEKKEAFRSTIYISDSSCGFIV